MYFLKMFLKLIWFRVDIYSSALGFRFGVQDFTSSDKDNVFVQAYHPCHITISDNKIYPAFQAIHQHISLGQKNSNICYVTF